jgi:hypothetical protein
MPVNHGIRYRSRQTVTPPSNRVLAGKRIIWNVNTNSQQGTSTLDVYDTQNSDPAISEKSWDEIHSGPPYLKGGPLDLIEIVRPKWNVQGAGSFLCNSWYNQPSGWKYMYQGGFYNPLWIPSLDPHSDAVYNALGTVYNDLYPDLDSLGSQAYARLRPQLARAGLGQALVEMREVPHMLKTSAKGFHEIWRQIASFKQRGSTKRAARMLPKGAGNQFLNIQFGWVPFLKDLQDTLSVYQNARQLKSQISRDNGRWIKRRRVDKLIESRDVVYTRTDIPGVQPTGNPGFDFYDTSSYLYTITKVETTNVWYEGSWKYYRPEFDWDSDMSKGPIAALQREMAIYGADINPTLIWKVTPWSWLADWFTNAGDAVQRAQDWGTDSMVSKYMYLMHHKTYGFELNSMFRTSNGQGRNMTWYRTASTKRRQNASTPFSFGPAGGDLTPRRLAILAALGLSRS